jgi:hypothetical protein
MSLSLDVVDRCKDAKMRRLIVSTLVSLVCAVPAAAQIAEQPTKRAAVQDQVIVPKADGQTTDKESTQSIEETLVSRLASAGLTDIEMVPLSFVARAKNAEGRSVILVLYPDSNSEWQVSPVDENDTSPSAPNQGSR